MQTEAKNIVIKALEELKERIAANIDGNAPVSKASGNTAKSMHVEETGSGATLFGRRAFGTLETGRKGGKVPQNFRSIIRQWILDKGISVAPVPYIRQVSDKWQPKYTPQERGEMSLAGALRIKFKMKARRCTAPAGETIFIHRKYPKPLPE
jgi:hypothetical protein